MIINDTDYLHFHHHDDSPHRVRKVVMENWRSVRKLFGFALLLLANEERDEQEYVFV